MKTTKAQALPWKKCTLGDAIKLQRGFDLPGRLRRAGLIPIVSSSGITDYHQIAAASGPGVVTGRYGTIGEVFYVEGDYWPLNTTLYVKDFKGNSPLFISHLLKTVDFASHSGKSGVPGVNRNDLHELEISLPPLAEQNAIASALSDMDALLAKLDQLIAKKRDIKQAAMQELLMGRRRLTGFSGEWNNTPISRIARIISGATPSTDIPSFWNGGINWCTPTDITKQSGKYLTATERKISLLGLESCSAELLPPGALLLCTRATIGEIKIAAEQICTNQGFKSLVCHPEFHNQFIYYALQTKKAEMIERASGSTFLEISKHDLSAIRILTPQLAEQCAIATALSDMDTEITALEARREKTRLIKQGMMQELLSGRVRLI